MERSPLKSDEDETANGDRTGSPRRGPARRPQHSQAAGAGAAGAAASTCARKTLPLLIQLRTTRFTGNIDVMGQQRKWLTLFDHLVGGGKQRRRDGQTERIGGLEVDDQFELRRSLNW